MGDGVTCSWDLVEDLCTPDCMVMGEGSAPCDVLVASPETIGKVIAVSNAKVCELHREAYIASCKGSSDGNDHFMTEINVQELHAGPVREVVLRMLSLEDKGLFKLYSLQVMPAENVQPQPRSTQNSQMDAIRDMLNNVDKGKHDDPQQNLMAAIAQAALKPTSRLVSERSQTGGSEADRPESVGQAGLQFNKASAARHRMENVSLWSPGETGPQHRTAQGTEAEQIQETQHHYLESFERSLQGSVDSILQAALAKFETSLEAIVDKQLQRFQHEIDETTKQPISDSHSKSCKPDIAVKQE